LTVLDPLQSMGSQLLRVLDLADTRDSDPARIACSCLVSYTFIYALCVLPLSKAGRRLLASALSCQDGDSRSRFPHRCRRLIM